ncbi:MAG: DUF4397 domain-containing protein, partial [Ferruginibacter sp.]|nr:DUF4397 domain-containing protein [Ferruginibacter sp.]
MKYKITLIVLTALTLSSLFGCKKNVLRSTETFLPDDKAYVKFALLSPNTPAVMIKVNEQKVNATTAGFLGVFPTTLNFQDYVALPTTSTIKFSLPNLGTGNDSIIINTTQLTFQPKKFYSATLADTGVDRTLFSVLDDENIPLTADSFYNIRLIHAMAKSPNLSLIRVDSTNATSFIRDTIINDIAFKSASKLVTVPVYSKRIGTSTTFHSFVRYRLFVTSTGVSIANLV